MLTYATLSQFKRIKNIPSTETSADSVIVEYLVSATRYIDRYCRRGFFPSYEIRPHAIPHKVVDLARRRFVSGDIFLDKDLLEVDEVKNGDNEVLVENTDFILLATNIFPKFAISLLYPNFWRVGSSMILNFDKPEVTIKGWWGYSDEWSLAWINTLEVSPNIDNSQVTFTLTNVDGLDDEGFTRFEIGMLIKCEEELMQINAVNTITNVLTVKRGANGTTAAAHNGQPIYRWRVHEDIKEACLKIAKVFREADEAAGGRLGVSDVNSGVEISIPSDPLGIVKSYVRRIV